MVLVIEGGRMNKLQADIEARKIFQESNAKADQIIKEAKKNGTWNKGLDSNKSLLAELHKETKQKIDLLYSMIDETQQ